MRETSAAMGVVESLAEGPLVFYIFDFEASGSWREYWAVSGYLKILVERGWGPQQPYSAFKPAGPGGHLEFTDMIIPMQCIGEPPVHSYLHKWNAHRLEAAAKSGRGVLNI
jgi:hypothetical protein